MIIINNTECNAITFKSFALKKTMQPLTGEYQVLKVSPKNGCERYRGGNRMEHLPATPTFPMTSKVFMRRKNKQTSQEKQAGPMVRGCE